MKVNKGTIIIAAAVLAAIIVAIIGVNGVHANAIAYAEKVTEAQSAIKVQEKRRADLIPNLADAIKSYDKYEYETLVELVKARTARDGGITDETQNEIHQIIDIVMEDYPDLKSQDNYKEFMKESAITENKIAETREAYNKAVSRYNTYTLNPINKFFLNLTGYEREEFQKLSYDVSEDAPTNLFD